MKSKRQFRRTTILTMFCIACLVGLGLARLVEFSFLPVALFGGMVALFASRRSIVLLITVVMLGLCLGGWRGTEYLSRVQAYKKLERSPVILQVTAKNDAVYSEKSQLSFDAGDIRILDPYESRLVGTMGIKGFGEPMVYAGDVVQVEGKLFPTRGSRQAIVSYADLKVLHRSDSGINKLRRRFSAAMVSVLPEPLGSFSLGLLIGQRTTLPKSFNDQLSVTGLTHIVAVSGYNLTIIVIAVRRLLHKRSKDQSLLASLALISLFILFTGTSASIVRAAMVSCLTLWAWYYGRKFKPLLLIALVAAVTALWYPIYLWSDLGWYLSFLAFFGILVIAPLLTNRILGHEPRLVGQVLTETISAQVMTLPLIMYIFGRFSLISFVANILVVPLVPLAMLLSFMAGLAGMFMSSLAGWVAWPAKLVLSYMVELIGVLSQVPHASVVRYLSLSQMLVMYFVLAVVCFITWRALRKNGKITDRKLSIKQENHERSLKMVHN